MVVDAQYHRLHFVAPAATSLSSCGPGSGALALAGQIRQLSKVPAGCSVSESECSMPQTIPRAPLSKILCHTVHPYARGSPPDLRFSLLPRSRPSPFTRTGRSKFVIGQVLYFGPMAHLERPQTTQLCSTKCCEWFGKCCGRSHGVARVCRLVFEQLTACSKAP